MDVIEKRRAYRSLEKFDVTPELIDDLAQAARLAPSCFNNQPWRFVYVYDTKTLIELRKALSHGNEWAYFAPLIIVVFSRKDLDCNIKGREYYLFDTGMASAFTILRATEIGYVAHPIAGFNEEKVKEILEIPQDMKVITLIIVGKHREDIRPELSQKQAELELLRPHRMPLKNFSFMNKYSVISDSSI